MDVFIIASNTLTDRLFFLGIGMAIGLILGWSSKAMRYAKEARDAVMELQQEEAEDEKA